MGNKIKQVRLTVEGVETVFEIKDNTALHTVSEELTADQLAAVKNNLNFSSETWTFTLTDDTTVIKKVVIEL